MSPPPQEGGLGGRGARGLLCLGPSPCPSWVGNKASSLATLQSWWAGPPYCSGLLLHAAPGRGLCVVLVRPFASLSRPPREQAGGARCGFPPSPLAGAACVPLPSPLFVAGASPPGVSVR